MQRRDPGMSVTPPKICLSSPPTGEGGNEDVSAGLHALGSQPFGHIDDVARAPRPEA
ncbi:MAG: hypothetical protein R2735_15740 [Microthrixaceae bacterium]